MKKQQEISNEIMSKKMGQVVEVLVENTSFDKKYLIGRTNQDVPDIDGIIYIENNDDENTKLINTFVKCKIVDFTEYDLISKLI